LGGKQGRRGRHLLLDFKLGVGKLKGYNWTEAAIRKMHLQEKI